MATVLDYNIRMMMPRGVKDPWDKACAMLQIVDEVMMEYGLLSLVAGTPLFNAMVRGQLPPPPRPFRAFGYHCLLLGPIQVVGGSALC